MHDISGHLLSRERKRRVGHTCPFYFSKITTPVNFVFLLGEEDGNMEGRKCITLLVLPSPGRKH